MHNGEDFKTGFFHRRIHYTDDPAKNEAWVQSESLKYGGINSARWQREMEINWGIYSGQRVWPMLSQKCHDAVFDLDESWAVYRIIDHGIRHPTCCLWVGVNRNGDRHFFREYYGTDKSVVVNCKNIINLSYESVIGTFIDPSTRKRVNYISSAPSQDKQGLVRLLDLYEQGGIVCSLADNSAAGYDKVTDGLLSTLARKAVAEGSLPSYLDEMNINQEHLLLLSEKPAITFDLRFCMRAFRETLNLRWKELTGDITQKDSPEKTVDVEDEGPDCVRYAIQSELFWRTVPNFVAPGSYKEELLKRHLSRQNKQWRKWA